MDPPAHIQLILEAEARIARVRAAVRAGATGAEAVGEDLAWIQRAVRARLVGYARRLGPAGSLAFEETLAALNDRLLDDILSLTYTSLETGFGAYLRTMPSRVLAAARRRYGSAGAPTLVSLDAPAGEDGPPRHEVVPDPAAAAAFERHADREVLRNALAALPPEERLALSWRLDGAENREVAARLGVSPATATRIHQRAAARLRAALAPDE